MKAIDAHQHFWTYHPVNHAWINDDMAVIRRNFLPEDLAPVLEANNVEGCVTVQVDQTEEETHRMLQWAEKNPFIRGAVGWVDLCSADIEDRLAYFKQYGALKGFRHILQGEDPSFMLQEHFMRGIGMLDKFGFTYDLLLFPKHLPAALQLVQRFPHQPFVIDHLAKPYIKDGLLDQWQNDIGLLAAHDNVYCKVSGMVTEADWKRWTKADLYPYMDVGVQAFGTNRLMFGSDWPVCLVAASYKVWIDTVREYFSGFTTDEQEQLFRNNAVSFYHL